MSISTICQFCEYANNATMLHLDVDNGAAERSKRVYMTSMNAACVAGVISENLLLAGASIPPEGMMHFNMFQLSPNFREFFRPRRKFPKFHLFLQNF